MNGKFNKKERENIEKILMVISQNARASSEEISRKVGLTRQTINRLLKKMQQEKTLWGYAPIFDREEFGKKIFLLLVKLKISENPDEFLKLVKDDTQIKLNQDSNFILTAYTHGNYDFVIMLAADSTIEAKKITNILINRYRKYFRDVETLEIITLFREAGIVNPNFKQKWDELFS